MSAGESKLIEDRHRRLYKKYLDDGKKLLQNEDYLQASEKFWGASSQMVKTVAAVRGLDIREHNDIGNFVAILSRDYPALDLPMLYGQVKSLHTNFYEDDLHPDLVKAYANASEKFVAAMLFILSREKK